MRATIGRRSPQLRGLRAAGIALLAAASLALPAAAATSPTSQGKPVNTALPTITGKAQLGQTLTATPGTWSGATPIQYFYQWSRSNSAGNYVPIAGATQSTYYVTSAESGQSLMVQVKAKNADGEAWADAKPTSAVSGAVAGSVVPVSSLALPDRLMISGLSFTTTPTASGRASVQARIQITDLEGNPVQGALVKAIGLPYSWAGTAQAEPTGGDGWASIVVTPSKTMPASAKHLVLFVRATKPGGSVLAGISTRRLVEAPLAGPAL
ncbi:MAG TPA: hypothetical protein VG652_04345 [Gaiellaceae bacterium]|nr:hypothetical protein [Gaiellaceae bacterium]